MNITLKIDNDGLHDLIEYLEGNHHMGLWDRQQIVNQLIGHLTPPRPTEPTGLGAVVKDGNGTRWVRMPDGPWFDSKGLGYITWANMPNVVEVLTPGIEASES